MTRDEIYQRFGPLMLEAIVRVIFSEINILRTRAGLEPRTIQQGIDALETQLGHLTKYQWMEGMNNVKQ
jgi:hypothetical protein